MLQSELYLQHAKTYTFKLAGADVDSHSVQQEPPNTRNNTEFTIHSLDQWSKLTQLSVAKRFDKPW